MNRIQSRIGFFTTLVTLATGLVSCGARSEWDSVDETSQPIAEVVIDVDRRPCTGCADDDAARAAAEAQALRMAMKAMEDAARAKRLAEQRVRACIAEKERAIAACGNGVHTALASAGAKRAQCLLTNPCRVGGQSARMSTCLAQGRRVCTDQLNHCLDGIPYGAPGIEGPIIANAVANCQARFGQPCSDFGVTRACQGLDNYGGYGSTVGRCDGYFQENCAEPEAQALAIASEEHAKCLALAWLGESICLGHPTLTPM